MAAISGKLTPKEPVPHGEIQTSLTNMSARGGEVHQFYARDNFALGCARSSSSNDGLFHSENQKVHIAFDGRIFNIQQLIREYDTAPDIGFDILFTLYRHHGTDLIRKLDGSFSIVLWDETNRVVALARDHIGSRPLFYSFQSGTLLFASEIRGILRFKESVSEINIESLDQYLTYLYIPAPNTLLKSIYQVLPAQTCCFTEGNGAEKNVCLNRPNLRFELNDVSSLATKSRDLLEQSLRLRLNQEEKVGFLLSGGVDTATLVGSASSFAARPIKTFTLVFPDCPEVDERKDAVKTARLFQTEHNEITATHSCINALPEITRFCGFPVGNPASLLCFSVFERLTSVVDAVVCGDGGNEIFGGVYKYLQTMDYAFNLDAGRFARIVKGLGRKSWRQFYGTKLESTLQKAIRLYFQLAARNSQLNTQLGEAHFRRVVNLFAFSESYWTELNKQSLYSHDVARELLDHDALDFLRSLFCYSDHMHVLQQLIYARTNSFIPNDAIPYVEPNATAKGIFPLFPLLDKELMSFMYQVPFEYVYAKSYRYFMKLAFGGHVIPAEIFDRPFKSFHTPIDRWLKTKKWREIVYDRLSSERTKRRGFFSHEYVQELVRQYYSGTRFISTERRNKAQSLAISIWSLVALEFWCDEYL